MPVLRGFVTFTVALLPGRSESKAQPKDSCTAVYFQGRFCKASSNQDCVQAAHPTRATAVTAVILRDIIIFCKSAFIVCRPFIYLPAFRGSWVFAGNFLDR